MPSAVSETSSPASDRWWPRLQRLVLGPCPACGAPHGSPLCVTCRAGSAIAEDGRFGSVRLPNGLQVLYLGAYWGPMPGGAPRRRPTATAHALHRFKFAGDRHAGHCLARMFAAAALPSPEPAEPGRAPAFDAVVPIPLTPARLGSRGFNQAAWLARALARQTRVAYRTDWLIRCKDVPPQHGLSARARRRNVRGAFAARVRGPAPRQVLLVDDVCTTGSTLAEAAAMLAAAGACEVSAAVLLLAEEGLAGR